MLLVWYLFFGVGPVRAQRTVSHRLLPARCRHDLDGACGRLVLFLFALGVFSQTGYLFLVTLLFGGDASAVVPLLILTLKVATVSLASITIFSGLEDPTSSPTA